MGCVNTAFLYNISCILIFQWSAKAQIGVCIGLLLLTEVLYRFTNVPGFDQPFTDQHNFGNYIDVILMNKINDGGWVAINCIPTAVHTIAGALVGKLFISAKKDKIKVLLIWASICLAIGFGLDFAGVTPIIKRIATSSFTFASLGWCLVGLAFAIGGSILKIIGITCISLLWLE